MILLSLIFFVAAAYFLAAALVPRLRPPWRLRKELTDLKKPAIFGPRMGLVSCMGVFIGLGGFGLGVIGSSVDVRILLLGFACFFLGGLYDHFFGSHQSSR
ncbi:MAG: hypothetical protein ABMA26_23660 [Limisphaerales bacterium]